MPQIEIPLTEETAQRVRGAIEKSDPVFFRMKGLDELAFLIAHGSEDGRINIGSLSTSKEALKQFVDKFPVKEKGIKKIYTICCHGGLQNKHSYKGVKIESIHSSKNEIHIRVMRMIDGDYVLEIFYED